MGRQHPSSLTLLHHYYPSGLYTDVQTTSNILVLILLCSSLQLLSVPLVTTTTQQAPKTFCISVAYNISWLLVIEFGTLFDREFFTPDSLEFRPP